MIQSPPPTTLASCYQSATKRKPLRFAIQANSIITLTDRKIQDITSNKKIDPPLLNILLLLKTLTRTKGIAANIKHAVMT